MANLGTRLRPTTQHDYTFALGEGRGNRTGESREEVMGLDLEQAGGGGRGMQQAQVEMLGSWGAGERSALTP